MPHWLARHVLHFESVIEDSVAQFASQLPAGARVLDAGAGEGRHRANFAAQSYVGVDRGIGDASWDYTGLDVVADLAALPFHDAAFDAVINIVTLEHVPEPRRVLEELARVLRPGGRLLLIVPHEWEEHQRPHDYYRYTQYGLKFLLDTAGFSSERIDPVGGFFRLLSRRLLNAQQFAPWLMWPLIPPALLLPFLDGLDHDRAFTLGYTCTAVKR